MNLGIEAYPMEWISPKLE